MIKETTPFGTISLGSLIEELTRYNPFNKVRFGIHAPHSYRGYYEHIAFEPTTEMTIEEILNVAKSVLDEMFEGYKGGDFTMCKDTPVWIANWGSSGWPLTPELLEFIIMDGTK